MDHLMNTIEAIRQLRVELARSTGRARALEPLPEGATLRAIAGVERRLRCRLPLSYRTFLHVHDGLPGLLQAARLFGTHDLGRAEHAAVTRAVFAAYETPLPEIGPPARPAGRHADMLPFGMDPGGSVLFAWNPAVVGRDGEMEVIMWVNGLGDRCASFGEFLTVIRDMMQNELLDGRHELRRSA